jgi:hypothetical protein
MIMNLDQIRARIIASVWQAFAQSGVDLSAVPHDQQEKLAAKIAEVLMVTLDELLEENEPDQPTELEPDSEDEFREETLWSGRPFLSLTEHYVVTSERIIMRRGLVGRDFEHYELIRVQDIDFTQGATERMFGIGDIHIKGHDASDPEITLRNVHHPEEVYETMRRAWLEARKRHGLQFREFM